MSFDLLENLGLPVARSLLKAMINFVRQSEKHVNVPWRTNASKLSPRANTQRMRTLAAGSIISRVQASNDALTAGDT
jgi:hypothetical protein